jgi:peptidoglycan-associated lipoprotein
MKFSHRSIFLVLILIVAVAAFGCRTRTKRVPPPVAAPTETVGEVAPPPTTIESPDEDFGGAGVTTEELPSDLDELNRVAQSRGWVRDAFFDYDASTLRADAQEALRSSAEWLRANPQYNLLIEGHADERGTEEYNLALGDRRAFTARQYLESLGIASARIRTVSYGEERPFARGSNESAWSQNRRAHLVIVR